MRILTYKRTHTGDPGEDGIFGVSDCMGSIRNRVFDAVVGVGSKTPWVGSSEIAGKVTWVGVGPIRVRLDGYRGDLIAFEKFVLLNGDGPDFEQEAPILARRFYQARARSISRSYSEQEMEELIRLIRRQILSSNCKTSHLLGTGDKLSRRREKCRRCISPGSLGLAAS